MFLTKVLAFSLCFSALTACSLYRSEDRKDFESAQEDFKLQSLNLTGCSYSTYRPAARAQNLVSVFTEPQTGDSVFLWEYRLENGQTVFEADNLKGTYCLYASGRR